jgi:hypothetical protein
VGTNQLPLPEVIHGGKVAEEKLTTHLQPATMLKMGGFIHPSLHMYSRCAQELCLFLCTNASPDFIFGRASDLYLCLYNELFALFHYVFKFLTP